MKPYITNIFIGVLLFLLSGCYESEVPLSIKPEENVDLHLVKHWTRIPKEKKQSIIKLSVLKFSDREYLIFWQQGNDKTVFARGFTTTINTVKIMNLQNIMDPEKKDRFYMFFKHKINKKGILQVQILSSEHPLLKQKKFKTSQSFYFFMKKHIADKTLFDGIESFRPADKFNFDKK